MKLHLEQVQEYKESKGFLEIYIGIFLHDKGGTFAVLVPANAVLAALITNLQWCSSSAFTKTTDIRKVFCGKSQLSDLQSSLERVTTTGIADEDIIHCV